jgi:putative transcriptional regulator
MPAVQVTKAQIRSRRGRVDLAKFQATTEDDIQRQKRNDGMEDAILGPARVVAGPDIRSLRKRLGMTQAQFAIAFDLSLRTVQGWEQRHWVPDGPGRDLMSLIAHDPEAVKALVRQMREAEKLSQSRERRLLSRASRARRPAEGA